MATAAGHVTFFSSLLLALILLLLLSLTTSGISWSINNFCLSSLSSLYFPHNTEYSPTTIMPDPINLFHDKIVTLNKFWREK